MVVPVKIEGLEKTVFSRLSKAQVKRRWGPKVTVTILSPVALNVDPALKGKARRQAAGAGSYWNHVGSGSSAPPRSTAA